MATATATELEKAFRPYFKDMQICREKGAGWALLHLVVCMPDICGAVTGDPQGGQRYREWCDAYLKGGKLTPVERYAIRCMLLHEGTTDAGALVYWFMPPGSGRHEELDGNTLYLDVGVLHDEMMAGMRAWFAAVEAGKAKNASAVAGNLSKLVRIEVRPTRDSSGGGDLGVSSTGSR